VHEENRDLLGRIVNEGRTSGYVLAAAINRCDLARVSISCGSVPGWYCKQPTRTRLGLLAAGAEELGPVANCWSVWKVVRVRAHGFRRRRPPGASGAMMHKRVAAGVPRPRLAARMRSDSTAWRTTAGGHCESAITTVADDHETSRLATLTMSGFSPVLMSSTETARR
jgi:hypothetical protein